MWHCRNSYGSSQDTCSTVRVTFPPRCNGSRLQPCYTFHHINMVSKEGTVEAFHDLPLRRDTIWCIWWNHSRCHRRLTRRRSRNPRMEMVSTSCSQLVQRPKTYRLFIVEGVSTVGCALIAPFLLLDYPATTKRLTPDQRNLAVARLNADGITSRNADGEVSSISHWRAFVDAVSNWRVWWLCLGYMTIIGCYSLSYFNPTLVQGLGYTGSEAQ